MNVWGLLRVKDEARWIERAIRSIQPVCSQILVFDDHSSDGTPDICESLGCGVFRSPFVDFHESRDKDFLLQKTWEAGAQLDDYCLMIDGDEALHPADLPALRDAIERGIVCCSMHIVYLWDREDQIRTDRWYKLFRRPSLFRLTTRNLRFQRTYAHGNLHCSSVPELFLSTIMPIPVRLLHYGYLHRADRIRKYHWYNSIDPNNQLEDGYRHMVVGDLFPATSTFKHAGPLQLESFA